jgi:hypothetical protein
MEFTTVFNGKDFDYFINKKPVTKDTYTTLFEDYKNSPNSEKVEDKECSDEKCPRCSMIQEMASEIFNADDEEEAFEILRDIIDMIDDVAYDNGYKDALDNQIEFLKDVSKDIGKKYEE